MTDGAHRYAHGHRRFLLRWRAGRPAAAAAVLVNTATRRGAPLFPLLMHRGLFTTPLHLVLTCWDANHRGDPPRQHAHHRWEPLASPGAVRTSPAAEVAKSYDLVPQTVRGLGQ